ncbi:MAG: Sulfur carrier protein TtuD [Phycisphaerae bacterium]|nr:Sulfur carrier protein TtuD [Phycisphaerae bacterium]
MIRRIGFALCVGPLLLAAGCEKPATSGEQAAAPPPVRTDLLVSADWLAKNLGDPKVVVVDVGRDDAAYRQGHIPGARFLAWDAIATTREGVLNELRPVDELVAVVRKLGIANDSRVVLYDGGVGIAASRAYVTLDYLGMGDRTALLDGQWARWKKDGRPVSMDAPVLVESKFVPHLNPTIIASLDNVRDASRDATHLHRAPVSLIDARAPSEYLGEKSGENVPRGGHIPGAANVFSNDNVVSADDPVFKSPAQLREMYGLAGVQTGNQVISYCRTGGQASLAYFTLKYLGYKPALYDGSFSQWSSCTDTPVTAGAEKPKPGER